jgi:DeoR/GlpR family transcriptional regulator of sugar metabolism
MLAAERRNQILELLRRDERVLVGPLAVHFDVSEETIRRDLASLEQLGMAVKCYGGATLADNRNAPPFKVRKKLNVEEKKTVASLVAQMVDDGDFLMLDDSSTCYFVARALHGKKGLTIVTNSIEIILELSGLHEDWKVISTGGNLDQDVFAFFGRQAEETIRSFHVDKAIISCTGLDTKGQFTEAGIENANIKQAMMAASRETILAMDSHKFDKTAFISVGNLRQVSAVVTDADPGRTWREYLTDQRIRLVSAPRL